MIWWTHHLSFAKTLKCSTPLRLCLLDLVQFYLQQSHLGVQGLIYDLDIIQRIEVAP